MNALPTIAAGGTLGFVMVVIAGFWYYATPKFFEVGYMPTQPGSGFNHQIHAGKLGMDCRYCHTNVEESWHANVPTVKTCYGCHEEGKLGPDASATDEKVQYIRDAYAQDRPIEWRNIHVVPDYANFPHNIHVNSGVSCYSCHGEINNMPVVYQAEPLSMGWCLDCHRNPEENLVPPDKVTDLHWVRTQWFGKEQTERAHRGMTPDSLREALLNSPPEHCGACHF